MLTKGQMFLAAQEAIVVNRYKDSVGIWTIGVGHTKAAGGLDPATYKGTMPISEVLAIYEKDYEQYAADVRRAVKVPLEQHQFDAVVSWHYNTGAVSSATLTKKLNAGDMAGAAAQFDKWHKPADIKARREREKNLFLTGEYGDLRINVYRASPEGNVIWSSGQRVKLPDSGVIPPPKKPSLFSKITSLFRKG